MIKNSQKAELQHKSLRYMSLPGVEVQVLLCYHSSGLQHWGREAWKGRPQGKPRGVSVGQNRVPALPLPE